MNKSIKELIKPFSIENGVKAEFVGGHGFSNRENHMLLNREFGSTILIDKEHYQQIKNKKPTDDLQFKLIQRGFMTVPGSNQCQSEESILPKFFIIDLTQVCNFRCSYCFRDLKEDTKTIGIDILDSIIDFIIDYCKKTNQREIHIQPWGGEPLIAWDKICHIQDRLKEEGIGSEITIESNASLITKELAAEAYKRNIHIGVSIDGKADIHNLQRRMADGKPSYDRMMKGMMNLREAGYGIRHGIISVFTKNSLPHLEEMLEFLAVELKVDRFKLNIVKESPMMQDKGLCLNNSEIKDFQLRLLKKLIELNKRGYPIIELNVLDKLQNILNRNKSNICISRGCMGGKKMVAFDMDGRIFPCDITDYKEEAIGSIYDGEELIALLEKAHKEKDFFAEKTSELCNDCPWWFYCKGGCTTAIKYKKGHVSGVDSAECISNRTLYPELVNLILDEPEMVKVLTKNKIEIV